MKILMICAHPPWPPHGGTPLRSWGWLRTASKVADIGLISLTGGGPENRAVQPLEKYCDYIRLVHAPRSVKRRLRDLLVSIGTGTPYVVQSSQSLRMAQAVSEAIEQWQPDIVQAEWIGAAQYLSLAKLRGLPTVYSAHNVEHQVAAGLPQRWRPPFAPLQSNALLAAESSYARSADLVAAVSDQDKKWFQLLNKQVICIPNAIHPADYRFLLPSARTKGPVVFIGHLGYQPNIDAAKELIRSVLPLLRRQLPEIRLVVAGKRPPRRLQRLNGSNVSVLADIDDIKTIWDQAAALISPLHSGGGSRIKLLEAAACGVPVIATRFSAQGSALQPGHDFIAADDAAEMAAACAALMRQPDQWQVMAQQARKTVERHHSWDNLTNRLQHLYESLTHHHR